MFYGVICLIIVFILMLFRIQNLDDRWINVCHHLHLSSRTSPEEVYQRIDELWERVRERAGTKDAGVPELARDEDPVAGTAVSGE